MSPLFLHIAVKDKMLCGFETKGPVVYTSVLDLTECIELNPNTFINNNPLQACPKCLNHPMYELALLANTDLD